MRRLLISIPLLALAPLVFAGFSYADATDHAAPKALTAKVMIVNSTQTFSFKPATIKVKKGTTITWTNKTSTEHSVTSNNGKFKSKFINAGKKVAIKFTKTGTFKYHCIFHSFMNGKVIVHT